MCGIAGFAGYSLTKDVAYERLRAMCDAIRHRGPDSDGYFLTEGVALGMRRLSVIDVAGGKQPISNEDRTITVVFNGELYNHHELRKELMRAGHTFATRSDTEVLVHLYEERGFEMTTALAGMFAFAIWDDRRQTLFLARDRTGIKPLSYCCTESSIAFCSETRSLYAFNPSTLAISSGSVMQYLAFGYVPDPNSIFENVKKLAPGHSLIWQRGAQIEIRRYWVPPAPDPEARDEHEVIEIIRSLLDKAVRAHLESEVPLGAFLSGGLDSSAVVALMCRHARGRVKTFSIGFAEKAYDESSAAQAVAAHFGTDHTSLVVRPDVEEMFSTIASTFDEPFADSSAIPTLLVARLARQAVTVALSGDGGDELFGGYARYRTILRRATEPGRVAALWSSLGLMLPQLFPGRNRLINRGRTLVGQYAATVLQPVRIDEGGVASETHPLGRLRIAEQMRAYFPGELAHDFAAAMMQVDLETYLPGDILTKVDRTTMAVSLEARVPLLDRDLVDFALRLPGGLRVTAAEGKRLYRRALQSIVPHAVLSRAKHGFAVPLAQWFRGPLNHRIAALRVPSGALKPFVDSKAVSRLVNEHSIGRRDHSVQLWRLMVLESWLESYSSGRFGQSPSVNVALA